MTQEAPYGYWTYGTKDGLFGAPSTIKTLRDGRNILVKDPDNPAVLEDEYILWAVKNDKNALRSFRERLPTMDAVSQARLNALVAQYPAHFIDRIDHLTLSDNIQRRQVVHTRKDTTRNPYMEKPKKPGSPSRINTKPDPYPTTTETVAESDTISILIPTSVEYMTTVTGLPDGLVWNGTVIRGTTPSVAEDTSYEITITRTNSLGSEVGTLTLTVSNTTAAGPTIGSVTTGDQEVSVSITPGDDGGSPIIDYEYSLDGGFNWTSIGSTSSPLTITGLENGIDYGIQIRPVNGSGPGDSSQTFNATPSTTPSQPLISGITTGNQSITVTVADGDDGGSPITDYEYSLNGGAFISAGTSASPFSITGLDNGTSYDVVVRPVNANGAGDPSQPITATPSTVPGQPTIGTIITGNGAVTVPISILDTGGSPLILPLFEYRLDGGPFASFASVGPFGYVITGLTNGVEYDIEVRAINVNGAGAISAPASATPSTVPSEGPTIGSFSTGDGTVTINFTAGDDGGSPITDYEYSLDGGLNYISAGTAVSPVVISGLVNGTEYDIEIRPVNANGNGPDSTTVVATPSTVPSAPTLTSLTAGNEQLSVAFTLGATGGSAITDVEYRINGGAYVSAGTTVSPFVITGLTNGTSFDVEIRAVNVNGGGAVSNLLSATPSTLPDAPTITSIDPGDRSLSIHYTPGNDNGSPIFGYQIRLDGGPYTPTVNYPNPAVIGPLTNGTSYDVEMRAVNANGVSPPSNIFAGTPSTVPDAPALNSLSSGLPNSLVAFFTLGGTGGSTITDVEYRVDGGAFQSFGNTSSPRNISALNNGTSYDIEIRSVNVNGASAVSNLLSGVPSTTPEPPTLNSLTPGSTELVVAFTLNSDRGSPITDVQYSLNGGAFVSFGATSSPQTITGLTNGVSYTVALRAVNANGNSESSNSLTETPMGAWVPTDVSTVAWVDASDTSSYTVSGSNLTSVTDKAGTYSTLTINGTPTRVIAGRNSLNTFDFNGSESIVSSTFEAQVSSGNHWAIGVFRPDSVNSNKDSLWSFETNGSPVRDYAMSAGSTGSWPGELDLDGLSSKRISSTIGNLQTWDLQSLSLGSWALVVAIFNKTGNQISCRVNGSYAFTPVNDYDNSVQTNQQLRLMRNRGGQSLDGQMAEFFSVADLPGTGGTDITDVEKAEGYLAWKWGLNGLLPSGHPYKNSPP